jgi:hypothetical protein
MIVPSDDEWLDVGLVVERSGPDSAASVALGDEGMETGSLWWDEDSWSAEIVLQRGGSQFVRVEWSCVEQIRLEERSGGTAIELVIPLTSPGPALTLWYRFGEPFELLTSLPSQESLYRRGT